MKLEVRTDLANLNLNLRPGHTARTLLERSLNGMKRGRISATLVTAHKMGKKIDNTGVAKAVHR